MDIQALAALPPDQLRALIPGFLAGYMSTPDSAQAIGSTMTDELADWSEVDLREVLA